MKEILLVDDDRDCQGLIKNLLENEGMKVHCAARGAEALRKMKEMSFHLMITDFNMPGMDGMELARKALEIAPDMPIIMITGDILPEIPRLADEAKIKKVLAKPVHPIKILKAVRDVMGNRTEVTSSTETAIGMGDGP